MREESDAARERAQERGVRALPMDEGQVRQRERFVSGIGTAVFREPAIARLPGEDGLDDGVASVSEGRVVERSEERRVGKECRL